METDVTATTGERRLASTIDFGIGANVEEPTLESWLRGVREAAHTATRPRFTILKARQYIKYTQRTRTPRHVFVVCMSALPGLFASLIMPTLPLQDPLLGVRGNSWFYVHLTITIAYTAFSATIAARSLTGIQRDEYPRCAVGAVALITTMLLVGMFLVLGLYWRFPVPFAPVLVYAPWVVCISLAHILVLRERLRSRRLRNNLLFYLPALSSQVSQLVIYPAYSALFNIAGQWVQILLIAFFPLLKFFIKKNIFIAMHHVKDYAKEEAVSAVEISASMYQSMIVQGTPSPLATGLVIAIDVVLGVVDIKRLAIRKTILPDVELVPAGIRVLADPTLSMADDDLQPFATKTVGYFELVVRTTSVLVRRNARRNLRISVAPTITSTDISRVGSTKRFAPGLQRDLLILTQMLEMLQSIETILFVEYLEVVVPVINAIYVVIASQLPSAIYNSKLREFIGHPAQLRAAVSNIILYTGLQAATLVAVCVVIRVRYGLSPLAQIAFTLEKHSWSLQGKLVAWLPTILAFSVAHYGVDFTFKFDFATKPLE